MISWAPKGQDEVRTYGIDWSPMLLNGAAISGNPTFVLKVGATIDSYSTSGNITFATISGGRDGFPALFTATMVSDDGQTFVQDVELPIIASSCTGYVPASTTKRTIVEMAFEECGLPGYSFTASPEEISSAVRRLDAKMREMCVGMKALTYRFPTGIGTSDPDDESWVPDDAVGAVVGQLAQSIAPGLGKAISSEQKRAASYSLNVARGRYTVVPTQVVPCSTPRGAGNNPWALWYPYIAPATCC